MLMRFCLYGFLKNQKYFEPFLVLFLREKGLSFTSIGLLIGFREFCINLMEIPSGGLADLYGRRRCMVLSFAAYIVSFVIFWAATSVAGLLGAMACFAVGEAFRTGTHKAMIFTWLRLQGRLDEKTRVYGTTRSWSNYGSAISIIIVTAFLVWHPSYAAIFLLSVVPYAIGLLNLATYPRELEGDMSGTFDLRTVAIHLRDALAMSWRRRGLRRLMFDTMGFEGMFEAAKDYLQPLLKAVALGLPFMPAHDPVQRGAVLIGAVYFSLHVGSGIASRQAHRIEAWAGGERSAARWLWATGTLCYGLLAVALWTGHQWLAVGIFVGLNLLHNAWRPLQITRFDAFSPEKHGATMLSIESQAKSLATLALAPLAGWLVDHATLAAAAGLPAEAGPAAGGPVLWPIGVLGLVVFVPLLLIPPPTPDADDHDEAPTATATGAA